MAFAASESVLGYCSPLRRLIACAGLFACIAGGGCGVGAEVRPTEGEAPVSGAPRRVERSSAKGPRRGPNDVPPGLLELLPSTPPPPPPPPPPGWVADSRVTADNLADALASPDPRRRGKGAAFLLLAEPRPALPVNLEELTQDPSTEVRKHLAWALRRYGPNNPRAQAVLWTLLRDQSRAVQRQAVWSAGEFPSLIEECATWFLAWLVEELGDPNGIAWELTAALRTRVGNDSEVERLFERILSLDVPPPVRMLAARALAEGSSRFLADHAEEVCAWLKREDDDDRRQGLLWTLGAGAEEHPLVHEACTEVLRSDPSMETRLVAACVLVTRYRFTARGFLCALPQDAVRKSLAFEVGRYPGLHLLKEHPTWVCEWLKAEPCAAVRAGIVESLGYEGLDETAAVLAVLVDLLNTDDSARVLYAIAAHLHGDSTLDARRIDELADSIEARRSRINEEWSQVAVVLGVLRRWASKRASEEGAPR